MRQRKQELIKRVNWTPPPVRESGPEVVAYDVAKMTLEHRRRMPERPFVVAAIEQATIVLGQPLARIFRERMHRFEHIFWLERRIGWKLYRYLQPGDTLIVPCRAFLGKQPIRAIKPIVRRQVRVIILDMPYDSHHPNMMPKSPYTWTKTRCIGWKREKNNQLYVDIRERYLAKRAAHFRDRWDEHFTEIARVLGQTWTYVKRLEQAYRDGFPLPDEMRSDNARQGWRAYHHRPDFLTRWYEWQQRHTPLRHKT